jgi:hypothetical protein
MSASFARGARRRLNRLIKVQIESDGDHCSVCRRPLLDRDVTFYGAAFGVLAITGECCRAKLDPTIAAGFYTAVRT